MQINNVIIIAYNYHLEGRTTLTDDSSPLVSLLHSST